MSQRTLSLLLAAITLVTVNAARPPLNSRPTSARQATLAIPDGTATSSAQHHRSATHVMDADRVQKDFCLAIEPSTVGEPANMVRVPVDFGDLTFTMFCYQQQDQLSAQIIENGSWESGDSLMLLEVMKKACNKLNISREDAIFLDIGANIGWYSLLLAAAGHQIISFEPMQANEQLFRRSICSNPDIQQRLTYYTDLLSDAPHSNCTMYSHNSNLGDGIVSCDNSLVLPENYTVRTAGIEMTTLDIALSQLTQPILMLKMDVEGHEGHIFRGAMHKIFESKVPYVMFEFNYKWISDSEGYPYQLLSSLVEAGYQFSFERFHGEMFDPLLFYADPQVQQQADMLPNLFCVHERMLT